jgi:hypothetical protein
MLFLHPWIYASATALRTRAQTSGPYHSLGDIFEGQLANFSEKLDLDPHWGQRDFYQCCLLAVNESLEINNGYLDFIPGQTVLHGNISSLLSYQFPCTAAYNGSEGDQPQVTITYSWCHHNCGGWARTTTSTQSDWLEPLLAFILPTLTFCFVIPRRRAIAVPGGLFPSSRLLDFPRNLTLIYELPATVFLLTLDSVGWVATSIVMAGPMMLSGCLEILLNARILSYLETDAEIDGVSVRQRAQLLLVILVGNLDQEPAWTSCENLVHRLPLSHPKAPKNLLGLPATVDPALLSKNRASVKKSLSTTSSIKARQTAVPVDTSGLNIVKTKLASILESQPRFGSSVGIAVIFYTTSFFYSIEQIKDNYGDG